MMICFYRMKLLLTSLILKFVSKKDKKETLSNPPYTNLGLSVKLTIKIIT